MGRFLIVTGDFVKTGGMDRANYALARHLADRGDEVHLVTNRADESLLGRPNVQVHRVVRPLNSYLLGEPLLGMEGRRQASRLAPSGGRVVVNGGNCRWGDVNWVHHVHASDAARPVGGPLRRLKGRFLYRRWVSAERAAVRAARLVITTCERNRRDLIERVGADESRVAVVYYGIDSTVFRPADEAERSELRRAVGLPEGRPVAAFVGSLADRRKGFDVLFEAWRTLCLEPSWDADLVVAGAGRELPAWRERAAEAGLGERIRFLGFHRDVPSLMRACDAHVLPSRYEGYSLVTQEALACGLPALVTRASGIAERYPAELQDWLIPDPEDAADLAARLRRWREGLAEPRPGLRALSERLRSYTWDQMAADIAAVIGEGAGTPGSSGGGGR